MLIFYCIFFFLLIVYNAGHSTDMITNRIRNISNFEETKLSAKNFRRARTSCSRLERVRLIGIRVETKGLGNN